jgi:hypothetical protein
MLPSGPLARSELFAGEAEFDALRPEQIADLAPPPPARGGDRKHGERGERLRPGRRPARTAAHPREIADIIAAGRRAGGTALLAR